jgi:hypothetical protein
MSDPAAGGSNIRQLLDIPAGPLSESKLNTFASCAAA